MGISFILVLSGPPPPPLPKMICRWIETKGNVTGAVGNIIGWIQLYMYAESSVNFYLIISTDYQLLYHFTLHMDVDSKTTG